MDTGALSLRALASLAAGLWLCGPRPAAARDPRLGLTDAQILTMGLGGWESYASKRLGMLSERRTHETYAVYERAASARNAALAARLSPAERRRVAALRSLLARFARAVTEAGRQASATDAYWRPVGARLGAACEDTLHAVLTRAGPSSAPRAADVRARLLALRRLHAQRHASGAARSRGLAAAEDAARAFDEIERRGDGLPLQARSAALAFCLRTANTALAFTQSP